MPFRHLEERALDKYFDSIRHLPLLNQEEERINGRLWRNDRNPEGLRRLVEGNLRFVVKEARKFEGMGLDLLDLISEGNLGLIEGAKRFDPERENKFLTYASWWVRQAIFHALAEHGSKIKLPQKVAGHMVKLNRITQQLTQHLGRTPTLQELAATSGFREDEVDRLQRLQQTTSTISTEQGLGDTELTVGDSLEQHVEPSALQSLDHEGFLEQMEISLAALSEKERRILELHFGLHAGEPMTLEQIGKSFDPPISRERVRQLEERAFSKIRERRRSELEGFLHGDLS